MVTVATLWLGIRVNLIIAVACFHYHTKNYITKAYLSRKSRFNNASTLFQYPSRFWFQSIREIPILKFIPIYRPPIWPLGIGLIQPTAKLIPIVMTPIIQNTFP